MIDKLAFVHPDAKIGKNVTIGPWSYIGPDVEIGDDCWISSHVVIKGPSIIGKGNRIFQFASVGEDCQDKKYAGEPTRLIMGDNNIIRESVTIHRGTVQDNSETRIGSNNLFMAYVHIAHDCVVGDNVIMANNASIAGHCHVGDWAILGGMTGVHQFVHIGAHAFTAGCSLVLQDVPPFVMASGQAAIPRGLNMEGMKRRGFSKETQQALRRAYKTLYRSSLTLEEAVAAMAEDAAKEPQVQAFVDFVTSSNRGIIR
ncbi:acyl-ACP--UDP-N-acetylglucosamine O-acyltransferase [Shewanella indica]|uniref:Acyl-[acyl-carrier-protein]--UDP-N-acetylglucosamine O-acyltransferase n=1 Tax=Shewanella chilikensis TaxID=558541 RepID=A0A6G7LUR5_9GAMM|nr:MULTISPECIES: acyl-ACP--UDP-N-acetylglucosamine O-acyltransferase [Shewanella]MBO2625296.1 acyl-ACP--UDP-N-acetylglucosamine O-acyltransferase [Shewanella algae]MBZ4680440.1 acyl-[acyl-carrier-protein]--UDP-N-acetylglucosamine O-acyltransferase [Shewanella sp.]MCA0949271.1 acyl-ACP--UDP-N-acetylglucosamine O-acyltransferase [Shewanella chilikensis]MCE9852866.1 acyl-ACP--UDP-N-acetylglucosamine O-acyltransferase [Shewanella chilikensis]MCL1152775.1 acyl-ACP--UDP-N-acetylglucosamine O-acyltra